jgi:hypothetical protein
MLRKALEWASVSTGTPLLGNMEGCCFLRAFEINRCIKRYVKMPCKQVSLCMGLVGEPEVDLLAGTFREKMIVYLGSFLAPRGH